MENNQSDGPLPVAQWRETMQAAMGNIRDLGAAMLEKHGSAGERAVETAANWKLDQRQADGQAALGRLFDDIGEVMERLSSVVQTMAPADMVAAAEAIDARLPAVEAAFVVIRHAALDLLRWARRFAPDGGSTMPDDYRAGYAEFISFAPVFKPRLAALQHDLAELTRDPAADPGIGQLLSAISRLNGVMETARGFVRAIVEPSLDLVFQETKLFLDDWNDIAVAVRADLASELNDCCQFLLYDASAFEQRVAQVRPQLAEGFEASLYALSKGDMRVLFSVEEDPVFGRLTVTLYRAVANTRFEAACESLIQSLYHELL